MTPPPTTPDIGALRDRLFRHYLPLALATAIGLAVLANIAFFDANRYPPPSAIFAEGVSGAFPKGDYPPTGPPTQSLSQNRAAQSTAPPTANGGSRHTGRPAGGHGGGVPTTNAPSTSTPADDPSPKSASVVARDEHPGDRNTVLRMRRLSTMTGYIAIALIALTLLLGPVNLLLGRRLPVSNYLRRDVGIWAAIISVAHVAFGLLVKHGDGQILGYFLAANDRSRILTNSFGLANWAGLGAAVMIVGLATISHDRALRKFKSKRWKRLQRWNYALAVLAAVHAVLYGALWRLSSPYTVTLLASVVLVAVVQTLGVRAWRRRQHADHRSNSDPTM